jgi:site-specific recombinase XerD
MSNFKQRAEHYIKECIAEITYNKNAVQSYESEIALKKELLRLARKSLKLSEENLKDYQKSLEGVDFNED